MSLYLSGYVIEIGIKHKIIELGNRPWTELTPQAILYAFAKDYMFPPLDANSNSVALLSLSESFKKMLSGVSVPKDQKETKNLPHVKTITEARFIADGKSSKLHDVRKFIEQSIKWYEVSMPEDRETKQLKKFYECQEFSELYPEDLNTSNWVNWNTDIRYEISQQEHKKDAWQHLNLCAIFLQDILEYGRNDIGENFLEKLESDSNEIDQNFLDKSSY